MEEFRKERGKILDKMEEYFEEIEKLKEQGIENIDKKLFFDYCAKLKEGFLAIWEVNLREMEECGADPKGIEKSRKEYEEMKKNC